MFNKVTANGTRMKGRDSHDLANKMQDQIDNKTKF